MRVSTPTWVPARKCWVKWSPAHKRTIYVAGDVSPAEAMKAWQKIEKENAAEPKAKPVGRLTLDALCNKYEAEREADQKAGKIGLNHYGEIIRTTTDLIRYFGRGVVVEDMTPDDWTGYARHLSSKAQSSRRRMRAIILTMLRQADDDDWIDRMPKLGRAFRELASTKGKAKVEPFTADECLAILSELDNRINATFKTPGATGISLKTMRTLKAAFLLGINGGLTPADLAILRTDQVDWKNSVIKHKRGKTGVPRVIPLWSETLKAMQAAQSEGELLLTSKTGRPLAYQTISKNGTVSLHDSVSKRFRIVMAAAGVVRPGKGLSRLRHTCRSVASEVGDETAADILAGHQLPGMRAVYLTVTDARLNKVSRHVHDWLFTPRVGPDDPQSPESKPGASSPAGRTRHRSDKP